MFARIAKSLGRVSIVSLVLGSALLSSPRLAAQQTNSTIQALEPREAIGTILMSGLVGGILGLSTLSFYDQPQDNIRNISLGAGVGMIAAAIYMTYSVAESTKPAGRSSMLLPDYDLSTGQASARYVYQF